MAATAQVQILVRSFLRPALSEYFLWVSLFRGVWAHKATKYIPQFARAWPLAGAARGNRTANRVVSSFRLKCLGLGLGGRRPWDSNREPCACKLRPK